MQTTGETFSLSPHFEPLAHRGFARDVPENTIAAFKKAAELGIRWMEIDVHTTADGVVIIFHDHTLNRMLGVSGNVADKTWAEIQALDLPGGYKVPTLEEALTELPDLFFNIDLKDQASAHRLPPVIARTGSVRRVRIASFTERYRATAIRLLNKLVPDQKISSGASVAAVYGFFATALTIPALWPLVRKLSGFFLMPFDSMQVPQNYKICGKEIAVVTPRFIQAAHRHGITVQVWTIDDSETMEKLFRMGVDGIVTNQVDLIQEVRKNFS